METTAVAFEPIGRVIAQDGRYFIELKEDAADAAQGIGEFGHIQVLWWFHLYDSDQTRAMHTLQKPYKRGPQTLGAFATRSPVRPNPIAVTPCALLGYDEANRRLELAYIDAQDGTPVLDIKPYMPSIDRVRDVKMPGWCADWPMYLEDSAAFDWSSVFNF